MKYRTLDTVVLNEDLPSLGLCAGDLGAVVDLHPPEELEVEFVTAAGTTRALVTLKVTQVRPAEGNDLLTVRRLA